MRNLRILILETNINYGNRLCDYLTYKEGSPFDIHLYLEHPMADTETLSQADAVLITSSLINLYDSFLPQDKTLILDENGRGEGEQFRYLYKFQSAADIYKELLLLCLDRTGPMRSAALGGRSCRITAVLTALYTEEKAGYIRESLAQPDMGEKHLYIPLGLVSAFMTSTEKQAAEGLSDIIYLVKQRKNNLGSRISLMAVKERYDHLLPAIAPEEIGELSGEDFGYLMEQIRQGTEYTTIILDFCSALPPAELAAYCDEFRLLKSASDWENFIAERLREGLERLCPGEASERIYEVVIQENKGNTIKI